MQTNNEKRFAEKPPIDVAVQRTMLDCKRYKGEFSKWKQFRARLEYFELDSQRKTLFVKEFKTKIEEEFQSLEFPENYKIVSVSENHHELYFKNELLLADKNKYLLVEVMFRHQRKIG